MKLILRWLLSALTLMGIAYFLPGISIVSFYAAVIAALILGLINALIRPVLFILTLPINILTLGLFTFVLNALMFWFGSTIVKGFYVQDFKAAFLGALIMTVVSWLLSSILKKNK